jgi:hypothetical protein
LRAPCIGPRDRFEVGPDRRAGRAFADNFAKFRPPFDRGRRFKTRSASSAGNRRVFFHPDSSRCGLIRLKPIPAVSNHRWTQIQTENQHAGILKWRTLGERSSRRMFLGFRIRVPSRSSVVQLICFGLIRLNSARFPPVANFVQPSNRRCSEMAK